jgi:hypothetical protein
LGIGWDRSATLAIEDSGPEWHTDLQARVRCHCARIEQVGYVLWMYGDVKMGLGRVGRAQLAVVVAGRVGRAGT